MQQLSKSLFFDRIASSVLLGVLVLVPIFFIPFLGLGVEIGKTYFIALGVVVAFVAWIVARMIEGKITIPKTPLLLLAILLPVVFLISAFFSPSWNVSLSGLFLNNTTVVGMTVLALVFLGSVMYINTEKKIQILVKGLFGSTLLISLFQIVYLIVGPKYLNLGTFWSSVSNVVGKWNDLAIWYGLTVIVLMMVIQFMDMERRTKIFALITGGLSIVFLIVINFPTLWAVMGFVALVVFVYSVMVSRGEENQEFHFPTAPFIVLVISLMFFIASPLVGSFMSQKVGLYQNEIRPTLQSTGEVLLGVLKERPLLGFGPDRFMSAWDNHQPQTIVLTQFWNTNFSAGSGFIPTMIVMTGIVGGVVLFAFIILFLIAGGFHLFRRNSDSKTHTYLLSSFVVTVFLWSMLFVYTPGVVVVIFAFASAGIFVGVLNASGRISNKQIHFLRDPRHSFFAIVFLVILLGGSLFAIFSGIEKFTSLALYSRARVLASQSDISKASILIARASAFYPSDIYGRANTEIALSQINQLLSNTSLSKDIIKSEFQNIFTSGEASARQAIAYDSTNPANWINLASLYQNMIPLQIPGAYENSKTALDQAIKLSPRNPDLYLLKARLEIVNKNNTGAKDIIKESLVLKPNFINGIFMLAELEAIGGDRATAIEQIERAASSDPRNYAVFLKLGIFKYDAGDYVGAVSALERSITLNPTILNTRYLLGLSYSKVGRVDEAKQIFAGIKKAFPEDASVAKIIDNLNAGVPPLTGLEQNTGVVLPEASTEAKPIENKPAPSAGR